MEAWGSSNFPHFVVLKPRLLDIETGVERHVDSKGAYSTFPGNQISVSAQAYVRITVVVTPGVFVFRAIRAVNPLNACSHFSSVLCWEMTTGAG